MPNEKKYIDAEKLVDFIDNNSVAIDDEYEKTYTLDDIQAYLNAIPAADVAEVRHGKWEICCDGYYPYCSLCHKEPQNRVMTDFCPNCGAKMDYHIVNLNKKDVESE